MKKIFLLIMAIGLIASAADAQIIKRKKTETVNKAEQRVENKTSGAVDKGLDKVEEGISNLFKKKKKKETKEDTKPQGTTTPAKQEANAGTGDEKNTVAKPKTNSKFDFEPGQKELYFDNFSRVAIGDFPIEFNTNASGEVIQFEDNDDKWLAMTKNGAFIPEMIKSLPDNITIEFEVGIIGDPTNNMSGLGLNFTTVADDLMKDMFFSKGTSVVYLHPGAELASIQILPVNGTEIYNEIQMPQWGTKENSFARVSIWRQKGRLRVYVDEDKLIDIPRFFSESETYSFAFFRSFFGDCEVYITDLRYAVAGADTRTKLLTEGKFVTNEILFDVNSDKIKPESNNIIGEIGKLLVETPNVKLKIIGHTDSDGDAAANLTLSKKRAEAVKMRLVYGFGIDETRLSTDGKGEAAPIVPNTDAAGKAQNRRVEFIKQ